MAVELDLPEISRLENSSPRIVTIGRTGYVNNFSKGPNIRFPRDVKATEKTVPSDVGVGTPIDSDHFSSMAENMDIKFWAG